MSNSPLVNVTVKAHSGNYTSGRSKAINKITIHHCGGVLTAQQIGNIFARAGRNGSSNYGIGVDGSVGMYVEEKDTSWCDSNWDSNCRSVTIETSNSSAGGDWPVNDITFNKLVQLCADIAKRNGMGKLVVGQNLTKHCDYANTACPGPYLKSKMQTLADMANNINYPPEPALVWVGEKHDKMIAKTNVQLVKVKTGEVVKRYADGSEFSFTQKCEYNGKIYYRTEYSQKNNIDNGFESSGLEDYVEPVQESSPATEQEPEPTKETEASSNQTRKTIFQIIVEFIINIFTRKSK